MKDTIIIHNLQIKKLRLKEVKQLNHGQVASK